jgi:hypothetical protein
MNDASFTSGWLTLVSCLAPAYIVTDGIDLGAIGSLSKSTASRPKRSEMESPVFVFFREPKIA